MKEMNKQKIHNKKSLGLKMLALAVLPVLVLGIVLLGVGMHAFSKSMENHVQKEMTEETKLILKILDQNYPGEFSLNKDEKGNYHIYKGGKDITKDTEFIDNMKDTMGVEVTLFCQDVRLQTTLRDAKGRLFINTAVSSVITKDVLKKKKPHFYQSTTTVSNERNFAYYEPIFLQENKIGSIEEMQERVDAATARYHELGDSIKAAETRMTEIAVLRTHIVNYTKTRPVYDAYRKAGYSKRFLENHRAEITLHKAAKTAFDEAKLKKLPKVKELDAEYSKLLTEKKAAYPDYRKAKDEMQELLRAQRNVELFFAEEKNTTEKTQSR